MNAIQPITAAERVTQFAGTDLDDLCAATEAAIGGGGGFGWLKPPRRHLLESYWKGVLLVPERHLLVGRLDGVVAASVQLIRAQRNNEAQAHQAQLTTCFVVPWARGRGLGRLVVRAAEQAAREAGVSVINLDLRAGQSEAIRLFEELGYTRWGEHPAYAKVDGTLVSGYYYYKRLDVFDDRRSEAS
jgi:ribosomal protein S18 acetylase RimI-like enzyme